MTVQDEVMARLTEVFRDVFDDDELTVFPAMTAKDVDEWDSLMHITLVLAVEKEFAVKLNAAEVGKLENVGQMVELLARKAA
ncbi:acyl carrier protein [Thalassobaculum fulvum]|uniref:Acyl carrier protein n=1 Tax=Thalassobaculum fulvum TaxID=1633335 RepID=A0A918XTQ8_9PROT|nr:acyl carrier protein [Thalassobaculum fulvum]GHD52859.1 acyl carrier protein [Thalassobaculum fulvum]